jgi:hypothetical protein
MPDLFVVFVNSWQNENYCEPERLY